MKNINHFLKIVFAFHLSFIFVKANAVNSYSVASGASTDITEFSTCKKVTNAGPLSIFIPTKISAEWTSFYTHPPSQITIGTCGCTMPTWSNLNYSLSPNYSTGTVQTVCTTAPNLYLSSGSTGKSVEYSKNGGAWTALPAGASTIAVTATDTIQFRQKNSGGQCPDFDSQITVRENNSSGTILSTFWTRGSTTGTCPS